MNYTKREQKMLSLAKSILDLNTDAFLTGTLMLKIREIDLGRECGDIDMLFNDYTPKIVIPDGLAFEEKTRGSGATHRVLDFDGIILDILSSREVPEEINGFRVGSVKELISAKHTYITLGSDPKGKHSSDLDKLEKLAPPLFLSVPYIDDLPY